MNPSIKIVSIQRLEESFFLVSDDALAVEEPLEIKLIHGATQNRETADVSITMRTPGNDLELAIGFLFTEGIIRDILQIDLAATHQHLFPSNRIHIYCREDVSIDQRLLHRNFYTTSACGVCGKASIDAIYTLTGDRNHQGIQVGKDVILSLPDQLIRHQHTFKHTGGLHAAALFTKDGRLIMSREDVGRHNALDKLIGALLLKTSEETVFPESSILLLSGRASFELLQKAAMAGIGMVCAVGAPSSLAVETAEKFGITLIGFLRNNRFNIYSNAHCVIQ
mgnify:CR=1 FL=1